jgi:hypothetical protein
MTRSGMKKKWFYYIASGAIVALVVVIISNLTAAHRTREEIKNDLIERQFSTWDGSHKNLAHYIKQKMNDPDSYEHIETKYSVYDTFIVVTTKFRGKNLFGAKVINEIQAQVDFRGIVVLVDDKLNIDQLLGKEHRYLEQLDSL